MTNTELYQQMLTLLADPNHSQDEYEDLEIVLNDRFRIELNRQLDASDATMHEATAIRKGFEYDATWHLDAVCMVKSIDELQTIELAVSKYLANEREVYRDSQEEKDWSSFQRER